MIEAVHTGVMLVWAIMTCVRTASLIWRTPLLTELRHAQRPFLVGSHFALAVLYGLRWEDFGTARWTGVAIWTVIGLVLWKFPDDGDDDWWKKKRRKFAARVKQLGRKLVVVVPTPAPGGAT